MAKPLTPSMIVPPVGHSERGGGGGGGGEEGGIVNVT